MRRLHLATHCLLQLALILPAGLGGLAVAESKSGVRTTAYTHTEADHLQYGRKTAIGTTLQSSKSYTSAAADWSKYPVGTKFKIEGMDTTFVVDDYGRALVGTETIDLYKPSRSAMNQWGVRNVDIKIIEQGDFERSREILADRTKYAHCREMLASIDSINPKEKEKVSGGWRSLFKPREKAVPAPAPPPVAPSLPPPPPESKPAPAMQLAASTPPAPKPVLPSPTPPAPAPAPAKSTPSPVIPPPPVSAPPVSAPAVPTPAPSTPALAATTPPVPAPAPAVVAAAAPPLPEPAVRKVRPLNLAPVSAPVSATAPAPAAAPSETTIEVPAPAPSHFAAVDTGSHRKRAFRPLDDGFGG